MKRLLVALLLVLSTFTLQAGSRNSDFDCLVSNVYYESKSEPRNGMLAVALVTLNRVDNPKYPSTICGVVYQKGQFSWTKNKQLLKQKINLEQWRAAKSAAIEAYMNRDALGTFLATHFHNQTVNPGWKLKRVAKIGNHTFYRA